MNNFQNKLIEKAKQYNFNITEKMAVKFEKYMQILLKWNEVMNLTAIVEEDEIIIKHFIDSLFCTKYIKNEEKIIDVGTGAGFPGIPLAIYYNGTKEIVLVDSLNKRVNFLNEVVNALELKTVKCIHARAEELANNTEYREKFDIVVSRAVASLNVLAEFNSGFVKKQGKTIYMKGSNYKEEVNIAKNALNKLNLDIVTQDEYYLESEIMHSIIVANKNNNTPKNYPRSFGKIKKQPL